jgi:hypothetical protein
MQFFIFVFSIFLSHKELHGYGFLILFPNETCKYSCVKICMIANPICSIFIIYIQKVCYLVKIVITCKDDICSGGTLESLSPFEN